MVKGNTGNSAAAKAEAEAEKVAAKAVAEKAAADAAAAAKQAASTKVIKVPALSITSSRDGFRRAGRSWSKEATVVKLSELSKEQIAHIKGEALLTVTEVEIDEEVSAE